MSVRGKKFKIQYTPLVPCDKIPKIPYLEFIHDFLLDYDLYATILTSNQSDFLNWEDICFSTANAFFKLISTGKVHKTKTLKLEHINRVCQFNIDGNIECHSFVTFPIDDEKIALVQSAGGMMRANIRIFNNDTFLRLFKENDALALFGYITKGNEITSYEIKVADFNTEPKLKKDFSALEIVNLQNAFTEYVEEFEPTDKEINDKSKFKWDKSNQNPFYFVDPVSEDWICVDNPKDIMSSAYSIAVRSQHLTK